MFSYTFVLSPNFPEALASSSAPYIVAIFHNYVGYANVVFNWLTLHSGSSGTCPLLKINTYTCELIQQVLAFTKQIGLL